jgi:hypothetical protein
MANRTTKAVVGVLVVVGVAVGGGFGLHALWTTAKSHFTADTCTVESFDLDPDQAAVASTMVGAVTRYPKQLPDRAAVLVLAAALQESKLTNLAPGEGDRDSVGVLQQRPSQDWGKVSGQPNSLADRERRLNDVSFATTAFLDHLVKVKGWARLPLAEAVQDVQISADGSLYAQHEPEATALARALLGRTPAGISCDFAAPTKVAPAGTVAAQARTQLGITTPAAAGPLTVRAPGAHWQTAAWFVANADRLGIEQVAYAGRQWRRGHGWAKSSDASGAAVVATLHDLRKG